MADTNTGETMFAHIIRRGGLGRVLPTGEFTLDDVDTLASPAHLQNANISDSLYYRTQRTMFFWPGNPTGSDDYIRYAAAYSGSAGTITFDTSLTDATEGSTDAYLLDGGVHPSDIVAAMNRARRIISVPCREPLSMKPSGTTLADAGFQSSSTSEVTASNASFSKVTTANSENVYPGMFASGRVQNSGASGHVYKRYSVTAGERYVWWTLSRLDSGTNCQAVMQDVSNTAAIGTTIEHAQEAWQWMKRDEPMPSGCKIAELRHQGEGSSDDHYWNWTQFLSPEHDVVTLDTAWDSNFDAMGLYWGRLTGTQISGDVHAGHAVQWEPIPKTDYNIEFSRYAANPPTIYFYNNSQQHWFQNPVAIWGRRALSDLETTDFTMALTGTTVADIDLFTWATLKEYFQEEGATFGLSKLADGRTRLQRTQDEFMAASRREYQEPMGSKRRYTIPRMA